MNIELPDWVGTAALPATIADDVDGMRQTIALGRMNVQHETGGPFAAMIVHAASGKVVSVGMNLVISAQCSVLHAEIVAIVRASQTLTSWNLGSAGPCTLYTSAEPCAMCMGAIPWSGITRVVIGARDHDVREIGFDEGAKPLAWVDDYERRGIQVVRDVLRDEAKLLLLDYVRGGGLMYNGTQQSPEQP